MNITKEEQFVRHVEEWGRHNVAYSLRDLYELAKKYGIAPPMNCIYCGEMFMQDDFGSNCKKCGYTLLPEEYKDKLMRNYGLQ